MEFSEKVYELCMLIPKGKVVTYKQIAIFLNTKGYRAVGNTLNKNYNSYVPCHRVIKTDLSLGGFRSGISRKWLLLKEEGVIIIKGKVDKSCLYKFE